MLRMLKAAFWAYFQLHVTRREYTPSIVEKFHCMELMWIVWCPACLSWGHMGAQDINRLPGVPTYPYSPKSSSPQRRGSGVAHWSFPRWLETLTMFKWYLQTIWSIWRWVPGKGLLKYVNHGFSTQARCYIITLASDWSTCPHTCTWCWLVQNNHCKVRERVQTVCNPSMHSMYLDCPFLFD